MENNQMNQFFNGEPVQQDLQQPQQQFNQQPQQQFNQQPQQQFTQQPQQPLFAQGQQTAGFNQSFNMNNLNVETEITPEMKKTFIKASNIALASGVVLIIATIVRIILNFLALGEMNKVMTSITNMTSRNGGVAPDFTKVQSELQVEAFLGFVILAVIVGFMVLAFFVRTAKRKTIAINLIVFSSIFMAIIVYGLVSSGSSFPELNQQITAIEGLKPLLFGENATDVQIIIQGLKSVLGLGTGLMVIGIISLIGWAGMLVGGILRVNVKDNKPVVKW